MEFENTNYLGYGKKYTRFMVPGNALMYKGYDLNHSYEDCDVYVSLAKLKEHFTAGVTLSMKNCFGSTPCTIYGDSAPVDEPCLIPKGGRGPFHAGNREPAKSALQMINPNGPKDPGYRVPRVVADLVAARPLHLGIIDGVHTMTGGEGPWIPHCKPVKPGLLVAGTNCVNTDAVAMALMGFDPMADRGTAPFETSDSTLALAEGLGVGSRDLKRIEVVGRRSPKAGLISAAADLFQAFPGYVPELSGCTCRVLVFVVFLLWIYPAIMPDDRWPASRARPEGPIHQSPNLSFDKATCSARPRPSGEGW